MNYFYPVRYQSYIGVLQKNITGKILINDMFFLEKMNIDLNEIIVKLSKFLKRKKIINLNLKKKYILFNYSTICLSDNINDNLNLFKKLISIIKKDYIVILKGHPSYVSIKTEKFIKDLKAFLKKRKIVTIVVRKNSHIHNIPSQILVKLLNIKIVISDMSTTIFHISNIYRRVKCFLPLNFSTNNCSENIAQSLYNKKKEFFKIIGKGIKFVD